MNKLSVIIPYYNADAYIGDVLEDLLHQDMSAEEYEIIVVDDGSTEDVDILRSYCDNYSCIRYIPISHAGLSTARNVGLESAHGEYVFFCDSDDRVRRNVLGHLYEVAEKNNLEVLFFNHLTLQENDSLPDSRTSNELDTPVISGDEYFACHPDMCLGPWLYFSKRDFLLSKNLCFPKDVFMVEERMFTISLMLAAKRVSHIDTVVYYYIQRPGSLVHKAGKILQAKGTADCRLQYIRYLNSVLNGQELLCEESINKEKDFTTFITLHNAFRYLSISQNWHILLELRDMGAYPIREQRFSNRFHRFIQWTMNHSALWMTCCVAFHVLPWRLRKNFNVHDKVLQC